ncbi:DUF2165 family protein [Nitrosomonas aestuarii]|uniref:DUF2165 family protein n=1 Tax=Nitrosomonas aestuarii TaxID=52441 RepID=UPI000D30D6F2|nr:DUF2165 domain-containing protein [Nitrosomonas aestuarii]PTN10352.1 putative small integral membrane protein [Nitrosomonas aestuarii]
MYTRLSKIALVWAVAFFATLAAFSNVADYGSNFTVIGHVLKMDTTFPDNNGMWRAIEAAWVHHLVFYLIIFIEAAVAVYCWLGGFYLYKSRHDLVQFSQAKKLAILGLTLGILLWLVGFMAIGGEWFLMWQSQVANGQQAAFRLVVILSVILIYLIQPDEEKSI